MHQPDLTTIRSVLLICALCAILTPHCTLLTGEETGEPAATEQEQEKQSTAPTTPSEEKPTTEPTSPPTPDAMPPQQPPPKAETTPVTAPPVPKPPDRAPVVKEGEPIKEREPNNHFGNADFMALPYKGVGHVSMKDPDWYTFRLDERAKVSIKTFTVRDEKNIDVKMYLHDKMLNQLLFSPYELETTLDPGTYFLRVLAYYDESGAYGIRASAGDLEQTPPKRLTPKVPNPCPEGCELWGYPPPDGFKVTCRTRIGRYHGRYVEYYEDGQKSLTGFYVLGKRSGQELAWHPDGEKKTLCDYRIGRVDCKNCKSTHDPKGVECPDDVEWPGE